MYASAKTVSHQARGFFYTVERALITYPLVNSSDSDVTISSSDSVLFKVHKETLTAHSEVFPDGTFSTNNVNQQRNRYSF